MLAREDGHPGHEENGKGPELAAEGEASEQTPGQQGDDEDDGRGHRIEDKGEREGDEDDGQQLDDRVAALQPALASGGG